MNKKEIRKCYKMDLRHFLVNYCGLDNEVLISELCNLSHKELKEVATLYGINLIRTSFEYVTKEQIMTGMIIYVSDALGNLAPYVNPNRILTQDTEFETELDPSLISSVSLEYKFDKKGRQKTLKKKVKLRKDDKK